MKGIRDGVRKGIVKCETCEFFCYISAGMGECRLNPPISRVSNGKTIEYPSVTNQDWCGQWSNDK